jgi:hypothetical protein
MEKEGLRGVFKGKGMCGGVAAALHMLFRT